MHSMSTTIGNGGKRYRKYESETGNKWINAAHDYTHAPNVWPIGAAVANPSRRASTRHPHI